MYSSTALALRDDLYRKFRGPVRMFVKTGHCTQYLLRTKTASLSPSPFLIIQLFFRINTISRLKPCTYETNSGHLKLCQAKTFRLNKKLEKNPFFPPFDSGRKGKNKKKKRGDQAAVESKPLFFSP